MTDIILNTNMFKSLNNISKLSLGLYQGTDNDLIDAQLSEVIAEAIKLGINNFDVAPNYRNTRSENILGKIIKNKEDIYVTTKGGFVPFDFNDKNIDEKSYVNNKFISTGIFDKESFDQYYFQTFNTKYLEYELKNSLLRLNSEKIDLYYIHNPEFLLKKVSYEKFIEVMNNVLSWIRLKIEKKEILNFGISTWDGFFENDISKRLQLEDFIRISKENKIIENFKFIQFPFNILKTDAFTKATQIIQNKNISLIRAANYYNLNCFSSAPYGQGKINEIELPDEINKTFYGKNNFQKALSFCMSAPNIKTIILGTCKLNHLYDAIDVVNFKGHSETLFYSLFKK